MHLLLVGAPGVGKSTLIRRVLKKVDRPVFGFETKKEAPDGEGGSCPVYIYPAGGERRRSEERLVGRCGSGGVQSVQEGFDRFAPYLRAPVPPGHIVLMDELGFMEAGAEAAVPRRVHQEPRRAPARYFPRESYRPVIRAGWFSGP